tara:strand:- start:15668 stop:16210 length:543 start_codon:yes stop_codon:yes gene_type:complete
MEDVRSDILQRKLVKSSDYILREKTIPFDFANQPMPAVDIADIMRYNMIYHKGIGLAAPQIGYNYSIFAVGNPDIEESVLVFFNPTIVNYSEEFVKLKEGCVSFPNLFLNLKRPNEIRMRYTGATGITETSKFTGMTARIIQHEYDHLNGIIFHRLANSFHLNKAKLKQKSINRRKKNVT